MTFVLFDEPTNRANLLPLTFTRPVGEIRIGILTIREKWAAYLQSDLSYLTQDYLAEKFPLHADGDALFINGSICPNTELTQALRNMSPGQALYQQSVLIAFYGKAGHLKTAVSLSRQEFSGSLFVVNQVWDIFKKNGEALIADFALLTKNKSSQPLSDTVTVIGDRNQVFLEEGAIAEACIFNVSAGPVYLGKDAEVMEGSVVRGPFALCEHSVLKLSAKIYGPTTVGPQSKVGGEVSNSVIFGFSNKGHDGFLGNSVLGEWCNLGADTNNSNLKNNYGSVKLFNYRELKQMDTGLQFCGLIMGDHSKAGINTMFNTGTVVGVGANIFGGGFPPTHVPSFSWGGSDGFETYLVDKLAETAEKVFERRAMKFDAVERRIMIALFDKRIMVKDDAV